MIINAIQEKWLVTEFMKKNREPGTLPADFKEKMKLLLGDEYEAYVKSFEEPCHNGLRINRLKIDKETWKQIAPFSIKPVPWIENGFYYASDDEASETEIRPSKHPWYYAGLYYLQEPSAMTPASLLPVVPGDRVLDLCAAPGGKSTELGAKLQGKGLLFSNDISNSRAKALLKNLEMAGISNFCVSSETPEKLSGLLPEFFDKILVDAPCSGEGMFRRDPDMIKSYEKQGPSDYVPIQRSIVSEAVNMLKPGGLLLYSTCTFDEEENEGTIQYLLEQFPDMKLLELPQGEGFSRGIGLPQCIRLFPHRIQGEGHFIALLQKEPVSAAEALTGNAGSRSDDSAGKAERIPSSLEQLAGSEAAAFLSAVSIEFPLSQLFEKNGSLYLLPEAVADLGEKQRKSIRFLRTGLLLGEIKKGRFEPSQALAMALKKEEYPAVIDFQPEDERAVRYLKGETIAVSSEEEASLDSRFSWILVCTGGFPLGWAKRLKGSLKNKYYPGWRWQ